MIKNKYNKLAKNQIVKTDSQDHTQIITHSSLLMMPRDYNAVDGENNQF